MEFVLCQTLAVRMKRIISCIDFFLLKLINVFLLAVICKDPNEEYATCLFSEPSCSEQIPKSITPTQECRCKPGFLRENGKCVLFSDCREFFLN